METYRPAPTDARAMLPRLARFCAEPRHQIERRAAAIGTRGYKPFGFGATLRPHLTARCGAAISDIADPRNPADTNGAAHSRVIIQSSIVGGLQRDRQSG